MNCVSGKGSSHGKVHLSQFLSALVSYCAEEYF